MRTTSATRPTWAEAAAGPKRSKVGRPNTDEVRLVVDVRALVVCVDVGQAIPTVGRVLHLARFVPRAVASGGCGDLRHRAIANQEQRAFREVLLHHERHVRDG